MGEPQTMTENEINLVKRAQAAIDAHIPRLGMIITQAHIKKDYTWLSYRAHDQRLQLHTYPNDYIETKKGPEHLIQYVLPSHIQRYKRLAARGIPDDSAGYLMEPPFAHFLATSYPIDAYDLLESITNNHDYHHDNTRTRPRFHTRMRDGIIQAEFFLSEEAIWRYGKIVFKNLIIPEIMLLSLPSKPLMKVASHPSFTPDLKVSSVGRDNKGQIEIRTKQSLTTYRDIVEGTEAHYQYELKKWGTKGRWHSNGHLLKPQRDAIIKPGRTLLRAA